MEYRAWKKQNSAGESIRTSLLGYGCMRFPTTPEGAIDEPRAEALLNAARDAGVNYFDTAYPYHGGQSEPFVGRVIAKWPRESFYLATKMPLWQCGSLEEAQHIFEEQLRRLGVEYIDFYLLHSLYAARYDRAKEMGIVDWLWEQKKLGRIRSFGFSCHDNAAGLEHILRDQPWDFCQLHQGRHAGQSAPGGRSAPQGPAARSFGCLLGPALGGQPPERPCHPLGHERRGSAHG